MRDIWDEHEDLLEQLVKWLTVFTFVLLCWTFHRAIRPRETCVSSSFIRTVIVEGQRVNNCAFESRLQLGGPSLTARAASRLRRLENTPGFDQWFSREPKLLIEIDEARPRAFDLYRGSLRIGSDWIEDDAQLGRALTMALLKSWPSLSEVSHFQLEILADFILLTIDPGRTHVAEDGRRYDYARDVTFGNASYALGSYCRSPFRSLAHDALCTPTPAKSGAVKSRSAVPSSPWDFRTLLASALARSYARLSLKRKLDVVKRLREITKWPVLEAPRGTSAEKLVDWFTKTYRDQAAAVGVIDKEPLASVDRTLGDLDVQSPVRFALTIDLRFTPAWRAIVAQLLERAKYRPQERALLFTPEGQVTLPSGLTVTWSPGDIQSGKHVMVACQFPASRAGLSVRSDRFFAVQTCGTLNTASWDQ